MSGAIAFLCRRFRERSTYSQLVTCLASTGSLAMYGAPGSWLVALIAMSLLGALMPDGAIVPKTGD